MVPKVFEPFVLLVGCFGFNGPLRQYFSLYRAGEPLKFYRICRSDVLLSCSFQSLQNTKGGQIYKQQSILTTLKSASDFLSCKHFNQTCYIFIVVDLVKVSGIATALQEFTFSVKYCPFSICCTQLFFVTL